MIADLTVLHKQGIDEGEKQLYNIHICICICIE